MKKQFWLLIIVAMVAGGMLEARGRWHRGHRHRGHHHRGWGRGYRHRGYWGRPWGGWYGGYGWGPGVSVSVPIGGGGPRRPASVKQFKRENGYYPTSVAQFCNWARRVYYPEEAQTNCNAYRNYKNAPRYSSRPSGYLSFGVGGGYGGYGRRGWWW